MIKGTLRWEYNDKTEQDQFRDDICFLWCACSAPATNFTPENLSPYQFQCDKCKEEAE